MCKIKNLKDFKMSEKKNVHQIEVMHKNISNYTFTNYFTTY